MRWAPAVLLVLCIAGCERSVRLAEGAPPASPRVCVDPVEAPPIATVPGRWEATAGDEARPRWTRREGESAPPLVVRGVLHSVNANSNMNSCVEMVGARHGTPQLALHVEGESRPLYVFAKSRGPIGLYSAEGGHICATGGANTWVRLAIEAAAGDVNVEIAEVDFAGERRGQTSPFVVVVSDVDEPPSIEPAVRNLHEDEKPSDIIVRWAVTPRACPEGIEYFKCAGATIELSDVKGNVLKRVPLKKGLTGQLGCWPQGTGVHCGGPSGMTNITLDAARDGSGKVTVAAASMSDGYCPDVEECTYRETLASFTIPRGARLVPDPMGTWPPPVPTPAP